MKSVSIDPFLRAAAIPPIVGISQAGAAAKTTKKIRVRHQGILRHPPDDWFLGDETEAQKGLAPPSGPPTGSSEAANSRP